jgi:hypothetical protein
MQARLLRPGAWKPGGRGCDTACDKSAAFHAGSLAQATHSPKAKSRPEGRPFKKLLSFLSLTGFEAWLCLVNHVDAAFTADYAAITMPVLQRAK